VEDFHLIGSEQAHGNHVYAQPPGRRVLQGGELRQGAFQAG
jgi:hypothetical protein